MKKIMYFVIGAISSVILFIGCSAGVLGPFSQGIAQSVLDATEVGYDGTSSGLLSTTVQGAIDEIAALVSQISSSGNVTYADLAGKCFSGSVPDIDGSMWILFGDDGTSYVGATVDTSSCDRQEPQLDSRYVILRSYLYGIFTQRV